MKWILVLWLTAACSLPASALERVSLAVAETELFEAVGRLEHEGLSWFVDRADSNAPVLGASLEVELAGKSVQAVFRPARGDYLIADAAWLQGLRLPGRHALGLTVLAGEDSDLLAAELVIEAEESLLASGGVVGWMIPLAALSLLGMGLLWRRFRQGGRS